MKENKKDFIPILSKILESYKKYQKEIINHKDNKSIQKEYIEGLNFFDKLIKDKTELTNETQDRILKIIIMTLSASNNKNIIENSIELIEIIISNDFFNNEILNNHIINLAKYILDVFCRYKNNTKIINQALNLVKVIVDNNYLYLKNESLYDIALFLTLIILHINNIGNKVYEQQTKKMSRIILDKCIEKSISQNNNINVKKEENLKYYIRYELNKNLYDNYLNQIMKYMIDNSIEKAVLTNNKIVYNNKNEKGIDKGKYNWCFNCRNEANFFSKYLNLPVCSKKCENIIIYTERLLSFNTIVYNNNYSIFDDSINIIKLITYNTLYFLEHYLFNNNKNIQRDNISLEDNLSYLTDLVNKLLSEQIIINEKENKDILELIKNYVFPFLIEVTYFNKNTNNLNGIKSNMKLFELLINRFDGWYVKQLKNEIYIFTKKIVVPYFNKYINKDDYNNSDKLIKYLNIKIFLIDLLSSNLINFLFELYNNYDNYFYFDNIFLNIIESITNTIYEGYEKNVMNESREYIELKDKLKNSAFNLIIKMIIQINELSNTKSEKKTDNNDIKINEINDNADIEEKDEYLNLKNILNEAVDTFIIVHSSTVVNFFIKKDIIPQIKDFIKYKDIFIKNNINLITNEIIKNSNPNKERRFQYNYTYFPKLFRNQKEIKSVFDDFFSQNFSLSLNYDDFTASILAYFIKFKFEKIMNHNKSTISYFFSSFSPFNIKVLYYYINNFNFINYNVLEALHYVFNFLPYVNSMPVIDKVITIFVTKFIRDNYKIEDENMNIILTEYFTKLCNMIKEISISLLEDNDIQKQINKKKLKTINEYITSFNKDFKYYKENEMIEIMNYSYVYDIYNQALTNPINFYSYPNKSSLIDSNIVIKSNNNFYGIFPANLYELYLMNKLNDVSLYQTNNNMNIEELKNIINYSWSYFLGIFSKHISFYNSLEYIMPGIENILIFGRICERLKMSTISDAFFNCLINLTGLNDFSNKRINFKNILILKILIDYIEKNGQYIFSSWYAILNIISRINIYKNCKGHQIFNLNKNKNLDENSFVENFVYNANQVETINTDKIYLITKGFNFDVLKKFLTDLVKVAEEEIQLFNIEKNKKNKERFFSFNKLVYVININKEKLTKEKGTEIYKIINDFYVKLISENPLDDILLNKIKECFKVIDKDIKK